MAYPINPLGCIPDEVTLDWSARIYSPQLLGQLLRDAQDICREDGQRLVAVRVHPKTLRKYQESIPGWIEWFMSVPVTVASVLLLEGPPRGTPQERWQLCVKREWLDAPF